MDQVYPDEFAFSIFALNVKNEWPRRLLHIPSMTSRPWQPGNAYGPDIEPTYAIISYTWGRFEVPEGPRLIINGIDWPVPSINESHFTVTDLERVLQQIKQREDYVWIDIACIDQKRIKPKMEEVGRQASIFKRARRSYVWLNRNDPMLIQHQLQTLMSHTYNMSIRNTNVLEVIEDLDESIRGLLQDFWFSSLWTLQESVLKRQALILNKRGELITTHGPWTGQSPYVGLLDISGALRIVRQMIDYTIVEGSCTPPCSEKLSSLLSVIDESGTNFELCPNPNIQYSAAIFRKTTRPEDRIYAIMQIYGYKLGDTASPNRKARKFGIADLELQFLKKLTSESAILSQAFQHLQPPLPGQSWSIINHIGVPKALHQFNPHDQFLASAATISVYNKTEAYFKGIGCSLTDLCAFWKDRRQGLLAWLNRQTTAPEDLRDRHTYFIEQDDFKRVRQGMVLDHSQDYDAAEMSFVWPPNTSMVDKESSPIIETRAPELTQAADKQQRLAEAIITKFSDAKTGILYLGRSQRTYSMEFALVIVNQGVARKLTRMRKDVRWKRIGFCYWEHGGGETIHDVEKLLFPFKGVFA